MAKPKKPGGPKQKLSPEARRKKAARDLATAKTPRRTKMKAENQRKRRAAKGSVKGKDYDHNRGKFVSEKVNRSATKTTNNTMAKKGPSASFKAKAKANSKKKKGTTTMKKTSKPPKGSVYAKAMKRNKMANKKK